MTSIEKVLIERDGLTPEEAKARFDEARAAFMEMVDSGEMDTFEMDEFCQDWFGLEPDYLDDILY